MGLDVYLYKYSDFEKTEKLEAEYEAFSQSAWGGLGEYNTLSEAVKDGVRAKVKAKALEMGLDEDGENSALKQRVEMDSKIITDHYFKVGYFHSSYNGGGINNILRNLGVMDLYGIFEPNDSYCFSPNWAECLERVSDTIASLEAKGNYRCFEVSHNMFGTDLGPSSEKEALAAFVDELANKHNRSLTGAYSNRVGHFYHEEPIKVLSLIPGTTEILRKQPCVYVICEGENQWYINALKIVKETIEYVMGQDDPKKYYLHWSS